MHSFASRVPIFVIGIAHVEFIKADEIICVCIILPIITLVTAFNLKLCSDTKCFQKLCCSVLNPLQIIKKLLDEYAWSKLLCC